MGVFLVINAWYQFGTRLNSYSIVLFLDLYSLPPKNLNETWSEYEDRVNIQIHFYPVVTRLHRQDQLKIRASEAGALHSKSTSIIQRE